MKKLFALLFAVVCIITLSACGTKGTLVVYTEAGFAPFEYVKDGKIVGVDVEIMEKVGEKLGKKVVFEILEKAFDYLNDEGELWIVIRKSHGADSAKKKMNEVFGNCDIIKRDKGFYVLMSKK